VQELLATCPGLVGDIARYLNYSLRRERPSICLAAAFSFVSALISKRVNCVYNGLTTEPCLFAATIADTGSGKTHAQNLLEELMIDGGVDVGPEGFLLGTPASDVGLRTALVQNSRRFFPWDELGFAISSLSGSKNSCESQVLPTLMNLYSKEGKFVAGKQYAKTDRVDIKDPHIAVFGASTPERFFGAINDNMILDGFVPRVLLFFEVGTLKRKRDDTIAASATSPEMRKSIVDGIRNIECWFTNAAGDLAEAVPNAMPRAKMQIEIEVAGPGYPTLDILKEWEGIIGGVVDGKSMPKTSRAIYTRAMEQTLKVCLCLSDFRFLRCPIASTYYAVDFMGTLLKIACEECSKHVHQDQRIRDYNALKDKVLGLFDVGEVKERKWITERTRRWCDLKTRSAIYADLADSGLWQEEESFKDEFTQKKSTFFRRMA
jgi:hypothetical protein